MRYMCSRVITGQQEQMPTCLSPWMEPEETLVEDYYTNVSTTGSSLKEDRFVTVCFIDQSINRCFGKQWRPRWNAAEGCISSGSALIAKIKTIFKYRNTSFDRNFDQQPLKIQNGLCHTYCIKIYEIIHHWSEWKELNDIGSQGPAPEIIFGS